MKLNTINAIAIYFLPMCLLAQNELTEVVGDNYPDGRMINFEITTTLGDEADLVQILAPAGSTGQLIEFERGLNNIVGRIYATGDIEFQNAEFDGADNNGVNAALRIISGSQTMLIDGNEIDADNLGLYLNFNSDLPVFVRTADEKTEVNMEHESGAGSSGNGISFLHPGANDEYWTWYVTNADGNLELYNQGVLRGEFNDATGNYTATSDRRLKYDIRQAATVLPKLMELQPSVYKYFSDESGTDYYGFIAQDVESVFPNMVSRNLGDSGMETYALDYTQIGVIAVAALQELEAKDQEKQARIQELEERVAELEASLTAMNALSERLDELESLLGSK